MHMTLDSLKQPAARAGRYLHRYGVPEPARGRIRLYLFPYAGGSASVFRNWPNYFDAGYDLVAIQLPGRGSRLHEAAEVDYRVLVQDITDALLADRPVARFALYGHSMGALLAYHVALELARRGARQPECLFLSGCKAPHLARERRHVARMSDDEFIDELRRLEGTPEVLLDNAELMQLLLPTIKADFLLLDRWYDQLGAPPAVPALALPIVGMYGSRDQHCGAADIQAWQAHTRGLLETLGYNGGHFFLQSHEEQVVRDLRWRLAMMQHGG
ncbi:thioesterase II family protein [Massilia horti]|uniref:Thioesterase n=1 Tax=Massilia horti TaxID=2562153 RepID=A0A4Y9SWA1_9BURK|nr:alpha/beta fold hydrolase [Massilia horti]TFW28923.1 thioesterase [Massilia horti]